MPVSNVYTDFYFAISIWGREKFEFKTDVVTIDKIARLTSSLTTDTVLVLLHENGKWETHLVYRDGKIVTQF